MLSCPQRDDTGAWLRHLGAADEPIACRKRLRMTNGQEWLNEEIRRREQVIRIFPARASVIRLRGAMLMEQDEQWSTCYRYLDMRTY